ncbi:MAG: metal-sensitive transcriptional regulator [Pseudomonadota bacterium]
MRDKAKTAASRRLARIAGQVNGISRMIEEDRYCIDVVRQVQAVKAALTGLEKVILDDHLDTCVSTALAGTDLDARREKVEELVAVLGGTRR